MLFMRLCSITFQLVAFLVVVYLVLLVGFGASDSLDRYTKNEAAAEAASEHFAKVNSNKSVCEWLRQFNGDTSKMNDDTLETYLRTDCG